MVSDIKWHRRFLIQWHDVAVPRMYGIFEQCAASIGTSNLVCYFVCRGYYMNIIPECYRRFTSEYYPRLV